MDDGSPTLEVGFAIDTGGSFAELERLQAIMNSSEATALKAAASVERQFNSLNLGGATAQVSSFGAAATRELQAVARANAQAEKAGEALSRQLERQIANFGRTRAEAAALAAEERGLGELADRLRGQEAMLSSLRSNAAQQAATDAEREAQARRSAAAAYDLFEAAARRGMQALREQQALEAAANKQIEAAQARASAEAAVNAQLLERSRIEAALERTTGTGRIRATDNGATYSALAAKAADDEARAVAAAGAAAAQSARQHEQLAAAVRESHAAQVADADAAERLRIATDPLYAATKRLNDEIAESTRLYHAGATAPAEYARQQEVLAQRLKGAAEQHEVMAGAGRRNAQSLQMIAIQMPDVIQGLLSGQKPMTIFIQQGGQIAQIAMMAEGGISGLVKQLAALALVAAPVLAVAGAAAGGAYIAFKKFQGTVEDSGELTRYRDSLGLTHKEMLKLSDGVESAGGKIKELGSVTVTAGDVMAGIWKTITDQADVSGPWESLKNGAGAAFDWILEAWLKTSAGITAGIYGTANAAKVIWNNFATAVGDAFYSSVNFAINAMNALVKSGTDILNGFIHGVNKIPGLNLGDIAAPQHALVDNPYAGASSQAAANAAAKAITDGYSNAYAQARKEDAKFWSQVGSNARQHYKDRANEQAAALKANRTPAKPKVDHNALNAEADEAKIRNLYKLADAYGVSGAAALIAEARVKAESAAIKSRGDIEAAVERQVRLAIAQRVSDAAKATAAVVDQAGAQEAVNAQVVAGLAPAGRAADLVKEQMAELPLLAAIAAAKSVQDVAGAQAATDQLEKQRAARLRLTAAEADARFNSAITSGRDRLAELQEELRLVGATDAERVHALATLKATQEATEMIAAGLNPAKAAEYVAQQVKIADTTEEVAAATREWNDALSFAADKWDIVAKNVQDGARGMADAFGESGRAIGDMASIYADFRADQARADEAHLKALADAASPAAKERENAKFALATSNKQIAMYGDMTSAAQGFFKKGSAGYQALGAAEKVFRAFQFAMSVRQMIQDARETITSVLNSGARATAHGAEGVAAQSKLPFPYNIAAMAATAAALVAAGIAVLGGGGSSAASVKTAEDYQKEQGTGSVLGDSAAKSQSINNAMQLMLKNTNKDLEYSSEMVRSLHAIESNIGNLAAAVGRELNVGGGLDASKLALGTNTSGGLLGIGGLFSKSVTRELNDAGLQFDATTVGAAIAGGITANLYQEILKTTRKSGFLGIGGSTKTTVETTSTGAGAGLTDEVSLLIDSMRAAIVGAAGTIGIDGAAAMLDAFQINIGRISFKGLTSDEIESELQAVFSRVGDDMAGAVAGGVAQFQHAGEGMFETLLRLAKEYQTVDVTLRSIGMTFGAVGLASVGARTALIDLFGGLDAFTEQTDFFRENFLSEAEQMAPIIAAVTAEMARLGLSSVDTKDEFKNVVLGLDLSTQAGQQMYAALMAVAPAFAKTAEYAASLNGELQEVAKTAEQLAAIAKQRRALDIQLMEATGDAAGALAAKRADELAGLDETLRALQAQVWAAQDAAQAARDLAAANEAAAQAATAAAEEAARAAAQLASERRSLEIQLLEATGDATGALAAKRADELAALDESLRALQQQVWAAQDAAAANAALAQAQESAAAAAMQAAQEQAAAASQIAQQRAALEVALMRAQGNEAGAVSAERAQQLAATDESLRALQEQVWAAEDARAAAEAASQAQASYAAAQQQAAQDAEQLRRTRAGMEAELLEAQGNAAGALAIRRTEELAAMDASLRGLQQAIWRQQDLAAAVTKARDTLSDSYKRESDALKETIERFGGFGESLRKFRETLSGTSDTTIDAYRAAQARFVDASSAAAMGDAKALGELEGVAKNFLSASRDRAGSLEEYQRDVARVAGSVDRAIGATDEAVDYAQAQLDALKASVTGLIDIDESVISVRDAIVALRQAMVAAASPVVSIPATALTPTAQPHLLDTQLLGQRIDLLADRLEVQNTAIAEGTAR